MNNNILKELYEDDAVCFIASRHHVSTQETIRSFLVQSGIIPDTRKNETSDFRLEDNEIEILKGLMDAYSLTKVENVNT